MAWLSITDYAKRRGVSRQRISKLVHVGRLEKATRAKGKRIEINSDKADRILAANIDPSWSEQAKLSGGNGKGVESGEQPGRLSYHEAKVQKEWAKAVAIYEQAIEAGV